METVHIKSFFTICTTSNNNLTRSVTDSALSDPHPSVDTTSEAIAHGNDPTTPDRYRLACSDSAAIAPAVTQASGQRDDDDDDEIAYLTVR